MDIHEDIKNILDKQIKIQKCIPTTDDIVKDSALFEIKNKQISFTSHASIREHEGLYMRCRMFEKACSQFNINNLKFLFFPHDNTWSYKNNEHYTLAFCKKRHQNFITSPNMHILEPRLDISLNITKDDIPLEQKIKTSIFVGGPQGSQRGDYIYNLSGNETHVGVLTNLPIVSIEYQLKYLFQINIDGHSMSYDRLYWQMDSNSVPVYLNRDKTNVQLHDELILPNKHYIESTTKTWLETCKDLVDSPSLKNISDNGQKFIKDHFKNEPQFVSNSILYYILLTMESQQSVL